MKEELDRNTLLSMDDDELSRCCEFEFFKGSGPGGQHRNKVSSAVRVKLAAFGISAADCSERTQHRNRANALAKLRHTMAIEIRQPVSLPDDDGKTGDAGGIGSDIPFECSIRNPRYYLFIAILLDRLEAAGFDQRKAAEMYGVSPSALIRKISADPSLWTHCLRRRNQLGLPAWRK